MAALIPGQGQGQGHGHAQGQGQGREHLQLHITHCEVDGRGVKICGQSDKQAIIAIESALVNGGIGIPARAMQTLVPEQLCVAQYNDGDFYRARIVALADNGVSAVVYFIDYGNSEIVRVDNIRVLDRSDGLLVSVPPQAGRFLLAGVLAGVGAAREEISAAAEIIRYSDVLCIIEKKVRGVTFVSIRFEGIDFAEYLAEKGLVNRVSLEDQERVMFHGGPALVAPPPINKRPPAIVAASLVAEDRHSQQRSTRWSSRSPASTSAELSWRRPEQPARPSHPVAAPPCPLPPPPATYKSRLLELNSTHSVRVSFAGDGPELFAIRLSDDERALSALQSELSRCGGVALSEPPMLGSVCLGRFPGDGSLCRAVVIGLPGDRCKLFFVDFGITDSVNHYDIFAIDPRFVAPSVYALRFCLSKLKELEVTEGLKAKFKQLVEGQVLQLRVVPPEGPPLIQYCELYLNGCNVHDRLKEETSSETYARYSRIPAERLVENTKITVTFVDSCARFFAQLVNNKTMLEKTMDEVQAHCSRAEPPQFLEVRAGMPCCAKFPDDGLWYRAIIVNIRRDKITVNYVDYGNDAEISVNDLRPTNAALMKMEAQAIDCSLRGFENKPNDNVASEIFEDITADKDLTIRNVKMLPKRISLLTLVDESCNPPIDIATKIAESSSQKTQNKSQDFVDSPPKPKYQQNDYNKGNDGQYGKKPYQKKEFDSNGYENRRNSDQRDNAQCSTGKRTKDVSKRNNSGANNNQNSYYKKKVVDQKNTPNSSVNLPNRDKNKKPFEKKYDNRKDSYSNKKEYGSYENKKEYGSYENKKDYNSYENKKEYNSYENKKEYNSYENKKEYSNDRKRDYNNSYENKKEYSNDRKRDYENKKDFNSYDNKRDFKKFSPKKLENAVSLKTNYQACQLQPGETYDVKISWYIDPNNFYIQLSSELDNFFTMMNQIPSTYKGIKPLKGHISIGDSVLARYSQDNVLYRAKVVDIQNGQFAVQYVDFGNKSLEKQDNLWQLNSKLMDIPQLAIHCSLSGVFPIDQWTSDVENYFAEESYSCKVISVSDDMYFVSLISNNEELSTKIINAGLAQSVTDADIKNKQLNIEKIPVIISHIDSPGQFWIKLSSTLDEINAFHKEIQEFEMTPLEDREEGKHCIAKYSCDDQYYRALILDTDNEITTVRLIDSGLTDVLNNDPEILKVAPQKYLDIPPYALKCSVNAIPTGVGQWNEQATELFKSLVSDVENSNKEAVFIHKGETNYIDLYVNDENTTEKIINAGFAVGVEKTESGDLPICYASHINSPSEFWIQLENSSADLQSIDEKLMEAENFPPLTEIEEEVICAAKFPEDGCWYRAQIIVHSTDGTEVLFMDYGNSSLTDELRTLPEELKSLPALSRRCALQKPSTIKNWSKEAELKFTELAAEGATTFQVSFLASGDISIVELLMNGKSMTQELIALSEVSYMDSNYDESKIDVTQPQPCYISFCNSVDDFWIHYQSATNQLDLITDALVDVEKYRSITDISEGLLCISQYPEDELWYRSKILSHSEDNIEVLHIDYGSKSVVSNVKVLSDELTKIPALAKHCALEKCDIDKEIIEEKFIELANSEAKNVKVAFIDLEKDPQLVKILVDGEDVVENLKKLLDIPVQTSEKVETESQFSNTSEVIKEESQSEITDIQETVESEIKESNIEENESNKSEIQTSPNKSEVEIIEKIDSENLDSVDQKSEEQIDVEKSAEVEDSPKNIETVVEEKTPEKTETTEISDESPEKTDNVPEEKSAEKVETVEETKESPEKSASLENSDVTSPEKSPEVEISEVTTPEKSIEEPEEKSTLTDSSAETNDDEKIQNGNDESPPTKNLETDNEKIKNGTDESSPAKDSETNEEEKIKNGTEESIEASGEKVTSPKIKSVTDKSADEAQIDVNEP